MTEVALPVAGALASTMAIDVVPTAAGFVMNVGANDKVAGSPVFSEEVVESQVSVPTGPSFDVSPILPLHWQVPERVLIH